MYVEAKFWDRIARKYASDPIKNMTAYEATLERVGARLGAEHEVLEIGCGTGSTALKLAGGVKRYTGADVSGGMIEIAREKLAETPVPGLEFTVSPALETRFEPGSYDAVLGFNILHLVQDLPGVLTRAKTLLRPGGLLITKTPCLGEMGLHIRLLVPLMQWVGKAPYVGFFDTVKLEAEITRAGFELIESRVFEGASASRYIVARV